MEAWQWHEPDAGAAAVAQNRALPPASPGSDGWNSAAFHGNSHVL